MFESCALGVDPGVASLGLAVVARRDRRPELVFAGAIRTAPDVEEAARLRLIHEAVRAAIDEHRPDSIAIERVAWNKNRVSALSVARATGVLLLAAAERDIAVEEYGPLEVKMAVTGQGNASKAQVRESLVRLHGLRGVPDQPDAADAVAIAVCHLTRSRFRRAAGDAPRPVRAVDVTRLRA